MNRWFTSDPHFDDDEIISFCNRPFKNAEQMNRQLINNWNSRVKPEDEVYMLGDWCVKRGSKYWENQLNGKIIYIEGNHDRNNHTKSIIQSAIINYGGYKIALVHNPEHVEYIRGYDIAFVGHIHTAWKIKRFKRHFEFADCINVGVDVWGFRPVSINEILTRYNRWLKQMEIK